jgi:xanthine dehydrogenase accessory factor
MIKLLQSICHLMEEGEDLVLATIIDHSGSTARSVGTKMLIRPDGSTVGTIGGGLVEFETCRLASVVFKSGRALLKTFELTGADAATTDRMICGGNMEILLELINSDPEMVKEFKELILALKQKHRGFLVKEIDVTGEPARRMKWCLVQNGSVTRGDSGWQDAVASGLMAEAAEAKRPLALVKGGKRFFVEPTLLPGTVFLFGAGHVSRPVAEMAAMVDFRTVIIDDRAEYANSERFPGADGIKVIPSFHQAFDGLEIDRDSCLVILTRGHLHDKTVLEQALKTDAGYIGMIGSRRKRDLIYMELITKGFNKADFERVHAPIGFAIGAETPEEIAVSIVAELIQARAEMGR